MNHCKQRILTLQANAARKLLGQVCALNKNVWRERRYRADSIHNLRATETAQWRAAHALKQWTTTALAALMRILAMNCVYTFSKNRKLPCGNHFIVKTTVLAFHDEDWFFGSVSSFDPNAEKALRTRHLNRESVRDAHAEQRAQTGLFDHHMECSC